MFANLPVNHVWDGDWEWEDLAGQIDEIMNSPWYEGPEGCIYIVTPDGIEGPDGIVLDAMNRLLRLGCCDCDLDVYLGKLTWIPFVLRRFNEVDGFYHA